MLYSVKFHVGVKFEDGDVKYITQSFQDCKNDFTEKFYNDNLFCLREALEKEFNKKVKEFFSISDSDMEKIMTAPSNIVSFYSEKEKYELALSAMKDKLTLSMKNIKNNNFFISPSTTQEEYDNVLEEYEYTKIERLLDHVKYFQKVIGGNCGKITKEDIPKINELMEYFFDDLDFLNVLTELKTEI